MHQWIILKRKKNKEKYIASHSGRVESSFRQRRRRDLYKASLIFHRLFFSFSSLTVISLQSAAVGTNLQWRNWNFCSRTGRSILNWRSSLYKNQVAIVVSILYSSGLNCNWHGWLLQGRRRSADQAIRRFPHRQDFQSLPFNGSTLLSFFV